MFKECRLLVYNFGIINTVPVCHFSLHWYTCQLLYSMVNTNKFILLSSYLVCGFHCYLIIDKTVVVRQLKLHVIKVIHTTPIVSFTLSRCSPRCAPAVCSRRTGANRDKSWRNSSAFIHCRQCYGSDPVFGKKWSRSFPGMLQFATVHSRCSPGGATMCPATSQSPRLCPGQRRQSPECHYGESRE